jgi:hypothetical protein
MLHKLIGLLKRPTDMSLGTAVVAKDMRLGPSVSGLEEIHDQPDITPDQPFDDGGGVVREERRCRENLLVAAGQTARQSATNPQSVYPCSPGNIVRRVEKTA